MADDNDSMPADANRMGPFTLCTICSSIRFALLDHAMRGRVKLHWNIAYHSAMLDVIEAWQLAEGLIPNELSAFKR